MTEMRTETGFLYNIGMLRFISRDFVQYGLSSAQNVTEHTFRVVMLSWLIAEREGADVAKAIQMALVHDIPESRTLDHGVVSSHYVEVKEEQAANDIFEGVLSDAVALWQEYETRETLEARIVKDADLLDVAMEGREFELRGLNMPDFWTEEVEAYTDILFTETACQLLTEIQQQSPVEWTHRYHDSRLHRLRQTKQSPKTKVA